MLSSADAHFICNSFPRFLMYICLWFLLCVGSNAAPLPHLDLSAIDAADVGLDEQVTLTTSAVNDFVAALSTAVFGDAVVDTAGDGVAVNATAAATALVDVLTALADALPTTVTTTLPNADATVINATVPGTTNAVTTATDAISGAALGTVNAATGNLTQTLFNIIDGAAFNVTNANGSIALDAATLAANRATLQDQANALTDALETLLNASATTPAGDFLRTLDLNTDVATASVSSYTGVPMPLPTYKQNPFFAAAGPLVGLLLTLSLLYPVSRVSK
jgi:hypothetical protein